MTPDAREIAPAKLNLGLHVRGKLADGRHAIETMFAFCTDGDRLSGRVAEKTTLEVVGPFANALGPSSENLVMKAATSLAEAAGVRHGAALILDKQLPVASGLGGGSADAAAALRLLTSIWRLDPCHATAVAPKLGSDVPACLLSLPMRGEGPGDQLTSVELEGIQGAPVLLVNPRVPLATAKVFQSWDGLDRGTLADWRQGRNDLEPAAIRLVPKIRSILDWLSNQHGSSFVRMSGSGATCFAIFDNEDARDAAASAAPEDWWRLATYLR